MTQSEMNLAMHPYAKAAIPLGIPENQVGIAAKCLILSVLNYLGLNQSGLNRQIGFLIKQSNKLSGGP